MSHDKIKTRGKSGTPVPSPMTGDEALHEIRPSGTRPSSSSRSINNTTTTNNNNNNNNNNNDKERRYKKRHNSPNSGKGVKHKARMTQDARLRGDVLIVIQAILLPGTCLITYAIATSNDHVEKEFPYISDTGTWPPESCIFGFLLVCYSICTVVAAYGRWRMIRMYDTNNLCRRLNNGALGVGFTAALGVFIVATFQETSVLMVHLLGAFLAFCFANIYMWMHSLITRRVPAIPGFFTLIFTIRLVISILTTLSALLVPVFTLVAQIRYDGNETKSHTPGTGKWESYMDGYNMHVAASSLEWTLAFYASFYFLTFIREFRHIYFGMPLVNLNATQISDHDRMTGDIENRGYTNGDVDST